MVVVLSNKGIGVEHYPRVITVYGDFPMAVRWHDEEYAGLLSELGGRSGSFRQFLNKRPPDTPSKAFKMILAIVKSGPVSGDVAFYYTAQGIFGLAETVDVIEGSPALESIGNRLRAIEKQHGLKGMEFWPRGEGPPEWCDLDHEWERTFDKIIVGKFIEYGELEMAVLYASNREEFNRRYEIGRRLVSQRRHKEF